MHTVQYLLHLLLKHALSLQSLLLRAYMLQFLLQQRVVTFQIFHESAQALAYCALPIQFSCDQPQLTMHQQCRALEELQ